MKSKITEAERKDIEERIRAGQPGLTFEHPWPEYSLTEEMVNAAVDTFLAKAKAKAKADGPDPSEIQDLIKFLKSWTGHLHASCQPPCDMSVRSSRPDGSGIEMCRFKLN